MFCKDPIYLGKEDVAPHKIGPDATWTLPSMAEYQIKTYERDPNNDQFVGKEWRYDNSDPHRSTIECYPSDCIQPGNSDIIFHCEINEIVPGQLYRIFKRNKRDIIEITYIYQDTIYFAKTLDELMNIFYQNILFDCLYRLDKLEQN